MNTQSPKLCFINPATGEHFGELPMATKEQIQAARREMAAAAPIWAAKPVKERVRILRKLQEVLIDSMDEITGVMNMDHGKSRQEAAVEMTTSLFKIHEYFKRAPGWLNRKRVPRGLYFFRKYYVDPVPYGVVAIIGPWNYPFELVVPAACSALLAGNTVLVKPSEVTPATGVLIENLFNRVPELAPFVRFLHGDATVGAALVESKPDLVFLTGSTKTGMKVAQMAAETMTPFLCELGGKDPMIVLEDADIQAAAKWSVWGGALFNAGQSCVAVERIYVVDQVYDQFLASIIEEAKKAKIGYSPDIKNPNNMGPLTFERQLRIIDEQLEDAQAKGARIVYGGRRDGMFMEPTIIVDVDHTMKLMWEETFGPILPIMRVSDERHAIQLANHSDYGLSAYVWSGNLTRAKRVAEQLKVGTVMINDILYHYIVSLLPFGGMKLSGNARTHGKAEVMQFTQMRSYAVGYPPYSFDLLTMMRYPSSYGLIKTVLHLITGVNMRQKTEPIRELLQEKEITPKVSGVAVAVGAMTAVAALAFGLFRTKKS